jgi:hypothetical protein
MAVEIYLVAIVLINYPKCIDKVFLLVHNKTIFNL